MPAWPWFLIAGMFVFNLLAIAFTPLGLNERSIWRLAQITPFVALGTLGARHFRHHLRLHTLLTGLSFLLVAWPVLRIYNHVTMHLSGALPLADPWLAASDAAIGFSWSEYVRWIDAHPRLLTAMELSYGGLTGYTIALFLVLLAGRNHGDRCPELIVLFVSTAVLCASVGALFPAMGTATHYGLTREMLSHFDPLAGSYHLPSFTALRSGGPHLLDLSRMPGLVTMPSFHTAMGIIAIYCARGNSWQFPAMLALNLLMIASTPLFGSHYGIDLIAGSGIAFAVILVHHWFCSRTNH